MAMEMIVAAQNDTLLRALRVSLKRRVPARRGGDYNEAPPCRPMNGARTRSLWPYSLSLLSIGPLGLSGSNQENPRGCWVFLQRT